MQDARVLEDHREEHLLPRLVHQHLPALRERQAPPPPAAPGDKLGNFTAALKADVSETPSKSTSSKEIWVALGEIPDLKDLEDDGQLAIYDFLVADYRKFKSFTALPQKMKEKWVLKQIKE
uniref:Uncharacterized protein n=1 Tax=Avena sativa TaxID=4498 RepID=A0ACD5WM55_AVESA